MASSSGASSAAWKGAGLAAAGAILGLSFGLYHAHRARKDVARERECLAAAEAKASAASTAATAARAAAESAVAKAAELKRSADLKGKAAIVTGSTSGIGVEIARYLAAQGCNVVMHGSRAAQAGDEFSKIKAEFPDVKIVYCQASLDNLPTAAEALIDTCMREFKRIDILVNNAGVQHVSPLHKFPVDQWNRLIAIDLSAPFHLMRLAIPLMRNNPGAWGRIINISSVHGVVASVEKSAYIAAKHGLNGLSKVAALECAGDSNITVNSICPGWVHTPLVQKQIEAIAKRDSLTEPEATKKLLSQKQPRPQFALCADIAQYVVFLCSPAGNNITGATQVIDGAWSVQ